MKRSLTNSFIVLYCILCFPAVLWATRGEGDYGIIMALMAFIYSFPAGLMTLCFIIYAVSRLKGGMNPSRNQGKIIFVLSLIVIVLSILLPLFWMKWADWNGDMVQLMAGTFMPVLVLSVISAILAMQLKKRAKRGGDSTAGHSALTT